MHDVGLTNKLVVGLEDMGIVVVEADNHAAQNFEASLGPADAIDDRRAFANVLILLRLVQRFFVRLSIPMKTIAMLAASISSIISSSSERLRRITDKR